MTYYFFIHFFVFALTHPFTFDMSWTKLDSQLISTHACVNRHYLYSQTPDNQGLKVISCGDYCIEVDHFILVAVCGDKHR